MGSTPPQAAARLALSVVVPVRDNARGLIECVESLRGQGGAPPFELLIVDDGSATPVVAEAFCVPFALRILTQSRRGVSAARNLGWHAAEGHAVLFVDSDCVLAEGALAAVGNALDERPEDAAFQPWLVGDEGCEVGRIEGLRITSVQIAARDGEGRLRYANTAGFVLRRSAIPRGEDPFDVGVVRGEDTLLLHRLLRDRIVPRSIPGARVVHRPPLPLARYVLKHLRIGYETGPARAAVRSGPLASVDRSRVLREFWASVARKDARARTAILALVCYALELVGRSAFRVCGKARAPASHVNQSA